MFEKFLMEWLLKIIGGKLDRNQFGGTRKVSTVHYLIELFSFILFNLYNQKSHAVLTTLIDFSKAFNRINHNLIITKLADLGVPAWLLKIIMVF